MRHAIGHRLSEVRGLLGLSQKEFGRQIGVSYQHVSKYERGLIMPGVEVLVKIYECFSVNINWLLTGKGPAFLEGHKISLEEDIKSKESILKWIEIFWNTSTHDKKAWFIIEFQRYFQSPCDKLPRKTKDKNTPHR
ncbi:MAG: helix-turn-helix domain-containing protein [Nitrospirae bacterium]|nr:helix-turn-helix domain-containing protein [Nitrospirota bacterium]MCL5978454.1 helix-turn-helix domain-containing protein [Nitrospirota bacterium]